MQGIPEQKDGKACAYLVMCYMMDIIVDKDLEFATTVCAFDAKICIFDLHVWLEVFRTISLVVALYLQWKTKQGLRYTLEQIDEVRAEWAKQVLMFKV